MSRVRAACEGSLLSSWTQPELEELLSQFLVGREARNRANLGAAGEMCCADGGMLAAAHCCAASIAAPVTHGQSRPCALCHCSCKCGLQPPVPCPLGVSPEDAVAAAAQRVLFGMGSLSRGAHLRFGSCFS